MGELSHLYYEGAWENVTCETARRSAGPRHLLARPPAMIKRPRRGAAAIHEVSFEPILERVETNTGEPTGAGSARINRGDVFWIAPDGSQGPVASYSHPHVVVQDDVFNHSRITTAVVCALTSNLHRANEPGNVLLEVGEGTFPGRALWSCRRSLR
jgi:mRNA-degrading endonuclease toxin of MazEF toxin-antitoxin module